jgi:aspartyl/asparaginyl beta-hydroxylase
MRRAAVPSLDWLRGHDLAAIKRVTSVIDEHDAGLILGAFTRTSERTVVEWMHRNEYAWFSPTGREGDPSAVACVSRPKTDRTLHDFAGEVRGIIPRGATVVRKVACRRGRKEDLRRLFQAQIVREAKRERLWMEGWTEHPVDVDLAAELGLVLRAVKVRASSELWGVWGPLPSAHWKERGRSLYPNLPQYSGPCLPADWAALRRIGGPVDVREAADALHARPPRLADHYSGYNVGRSWTAAALRGYGPPEGADPSFIIKPAEMSRKWKADHAEALGWTLRDTPLRKDYPALEPLIDAVPGTKHRIRLMNLAPGGGELTRHADITDPDAGTRDGRLCRIHIPLRTNPRVEFTSWNLEGERIVRHMGEGEVWYLDTRKPHRAINAGSSHRLHLVMDVESSPALRRLLA